MTTMDLGDDTICKHFKDATSTIERTFKDVIKRETGVTANALLCMSLSVSANVQVERTRELASSVGKLIVLLEGVVNDIVEEMGKAEQKEEKGKGKAMQKGKGKGK